MSDDKQKRITFLFGAGISMATADKVCINASTNALSHAVFEERLFLHSDQRFYHPSQNEPTHITDDGVHPLLRLIKYKFMNQFRLYEDEVTYEDLMFFLINADHEHGYPKDPLLSASLGKFFDEVSIVWKAKDYGFDYTVSEMLSLAQTYIKCVIKHRLYELNDKEPVGFGWVGKALTDESLKSNIVTLNHDTILERYLRSENICFIDGFNNYEDHQIRLFDPRSYLDNSVPHLIKLHGSIDWKAFGGMKYDVIGIPKNGFKELNFLDGNGITEEPVILCGTHNKLEGYSYSIYSDLLTEFVRLLWCSDCVVICGYGFGDRGINSRLSNWLRSDQKNRIIVIYPQGNKLVNEIKQEKHMYHQIELLEGIDKNRICWIESKFENTKWPEVKDRILAD